MSLNVIILTLNGRRKTVKVSPNAVILQTLEDFCERENLDSEQYSFLFQRKILDETLTWRYANVPNNAKLELVQQEKKKKEVPVKIALQYEGGRLQYSFLPSANLWEIVIHWETDLSPSTPPEGHAPSLLYLRQEITGQSKLSATTLKSLGLTSGNAALRFSFKPAQDDLKTIETKIKLKKVKKGEERPNPPIDDKVITMEMFQNALQKVLNPTDDGTAMEITPTSVTSHDKKVSEQTAMSTSSSNTEFQDAKSEFSQNDEKKLDSKSERVRTRRPGSGEIAPTKKFKPTPPVSPETDFSGFKFPEETEGMDLYTNEDDDNVDISPLMKPCDRETIFYDEKEVEEMEVESEDPGDEFFELTVDDIRKMLADLRYVQKESEERELVTTRTREIQRLRAINQYPKIVVRIVFPNRTVLQGIFRPAEKVQEMYDFVKNFLLDHKTDFYLYTTPPRVVLKDKSSILYDSHLSPAAKVYFAVKNQDFSPDLLSQKCLGCKNSPIEANLKLQNVLELRSPEWRAKKRENGTESSEASRPPPQVTSSETPSTSQSSSSSMTTSSGGGAVGGARPKVPKWFKIGKN